jgi:hypothetical protein
MDGSFFAFAILGAFVGYIVGDFQRERRYRREARANLALSVSRSNDRAAQRAAAARTVPGSNGDDNGDGPAFALSNARYAQARRRAVRGDNNGPRVGAHAVGRDLRSTDAPPLVPAGGFDFDGD